MDNDLSVRKEKLNEKFFSPDVIVDFIFDSGLLFISIKNISDRPAYRISIKFNKKISGIDGTKEISALPLFKNIEFLAPKKEITTFLDSSVSYFARGEPSDISARITYLDFCGTKRSATIKHNLEIYKEIGYIRRQEIIPDVNYYENIIN
jgi:hypothetical protein